MTAEPKNIHLGVTHIFSRHQGEKMNAKSRSAWEIWLGTGRQQHAASSVVLHKSHYNDDLSDIL